MDWKDLASSVADAAPTIGSLLAGSAGSAAGTVLASVFGTEDNPDAVRKAIAADPEAAAKMRQAELDHAIEMRRLLLTSRATELQEETKRLESVNKTIRTELDADNWFKSGWRPFLGWVLGLVLGGLGAVMVYTIGRDPSLVNDDSFTGLLTWLVVTLGAVQGISIRMRSDDKARRMGATPKAGLIGLLSGQNKNS